MVCYAVQYNLLKPSGGKSGSRPNCVATPVGFFLGDVPMKRIPLSQGQFAIVDDKDYDRLNRHRWYARKASYGGFFAVTTITLNKIAVKMYMHREIMGLAKGDRRVIDHLDHNTLDNRRANLRICTQAQNLCNRGPDAHTSSQYKGVSWNKECKKWDVRISVQGKQICFGLFEDETYAARVYNTAAQKYHGKYARLNEIV